MRVTAYPRDPNPYQELLYAELRARGATVGYLGEATRSHTLNLALLPIQLLLERARGTRVLHLHWVYRFVLPGRARLPWLRRLAEAWFVVLLGTARLCGVRVVWTAHNVLPHERVFADDVRARRALLRRASGVIVHGGETTRRLAELVPRLPPVAEIPHGPYPGVYGPVPPRERARALLGIPPAGRVLLFFGAVQDYKGVEDLLDTVAELPAGLLDRTGARVVVAGRCSDSGLARRLHRAAARCAGRVELRLGHVPDGQVAAYFGAADAVVLPFRSVTTSGSARLALTMGRPLVVPRLAALADLPDEACFRYSPGGLGAALERALAARSEELAARGAAGHAGVMSWGWDDAARATQLFLGELAGAEPRALQPAGSVGA
ncbi:glycosyltransferase [Motilibacter aurantiacus]|uniref:glycosyltransferase n=1 Tax=Motilibacter aurantiacus TaxID=2714955 RepID=UPI0014089672|nr:glycosyltransferase [Motilibacter aurantiacus]NHC47027.1 glycosyltransferase [Motilibacter aurantiacus]